MFLGELFLDVRLLLFPAPLIVGIGDGAYVPVLLLRGVVLLDSVSVSGTNWRVCR